MMEIVDAFTDVALHEVGLTTQAVKNVIYVQHSARAGWVPFLEKNAQELAGDPPNS